MTRKHLLLLGLGVLAAVGLFLHTLVDDNGAPERQRLRAELQALQEKNESLKAKVAHLESQIEGLRTRPEAQERAVRKELGYAREGEVVIELRDSPSRDDDATITRQ